MTAKEKKVIVVASAILVVAGVLAYCSRPAKAAEKGELFLPISLRYIQDFGVGGGLGYRFPSGLMLSGEITYDQLKGYAGTTSCRLYCQNCQTAWSVPDSGQTGLTFTVGIPLGKKEAKK